MRPAITKTKKRKLRGGVGWTWKKRRKKVPEVHEINQTNWKQRIALFFWQCFLSNFCRLKKDFWSKEIMLLGLIFFSTNLWSFFLLKTNQFYYKKKNLGSCKMTTLPKNQSMLDFLHENFNSFFLEFKASSCTHFFFQILFTIL